MMGVMKPYLDPHVQRRNRILVLVLLAIIMGSAVAGVLYLRHYGFSTEKTESRYH
jgi:hypothetical protein